MENYKLTDGTLVSLSAALLLSELHCSVVYTWATWYDGKGRKERNERTTRRLTVTPSPMDAGLVVTVARFVSLWVCEWVFFLPIPKSFSWPPVVVWFSNVSWLPSHHEFMLSQQQQQQRLLGWRKVRKKEENSMLHSKLSLLCVCLSVCLCFSHFTFFCFLEAPFVLRMATLTLRDRL